MVPARHPQADRRLDKAMPDKYNITKLIPTANPNEISVKLTFDGALPFIELRLNG